MNNPALTKRPVMVAVRKGTSRVTRLARRAPTKFGLEPLKALRLKPRTEEKEKGVKDKPKDEGEESVNATKGTHREIRKSLASFLTRATGIANGVIIADTATKGRKGEKEKLHYSYRRRIKG